VPAWKLEPVVIILPLNVKPEFLSQTKLLRCQMRSIMEHSMATKAALGAELGTLDGRGRGRSHEFQTG
jgi:hypothetical protein